MSQIINYGFVLPDGSDNVDIEVLNHNMELLAAEFDKIYDLLPTPPPTNN